MELYEFQEEDVRKLAKQRAGLIGSEMGTGKTHEAIELDTAWFNTYDRALPTLIVAPLNTFDSWQDKIATQLGDKVDVTTIDRKNRHAFYQAILRRESDIYLMHWDAVRLMPELQKLQFGTIIGDEVHRISNRKAIVTREFKKLKCQRKLGLSGTASGDKPENLWSILNWLWPSFYTSYWNFRKHYCIEEMVVSPDGEKTYRKIVGVKNIPALMKQMEPWYVRHLKREECCEHHPDGVMSWLPEKTYDTIWVDLNPTQRRFYDQMRKDMVAWVNEHEDSPLVASVVVAQLTRLSQMALATPEVEIKQRQAKDKETKELLWMPDGSPLMESYQVVTLHEPSSKIDAVKELILDHEDKQFVIFSSSKQACYLAQRSLQRVGITAEVLSGDTPQSQREGMVARFVEGDYRVFIGVIQAAAEGIDGLQHATDTAIFLDRSWSTIKNQQAEDRLHRGGQKDTVQIIDIMGRNTLDFGRKQKLEAKWQWIKEILGDPNAQKKVIANDTSLV